MSDRIFELEVEKIRRSIIHDMQVKGWDSDHLVTAMADVIGMTAAICDLTGKAAPLDTRIDSVIDRLRYQYGKALQAHTRHDSPLNMRRTSA